MPVGHMSQIESSISGLLPIQKHQGSIASQQGEVLRTRNRFSAPTKKITQYQRDKEQIEKPSWKEAQICALMRYWRAA
jgi:hypothetical protein